MTNKEFILNLIRLIKRNFCNKITWLLVSVGVILIAPPLLTSLLNIFIESISEFNLLGENDKLWGLLLIILGFGFFFLCRIITNTSSPINLNFNRTQNVYIITDKEKAEEIVKTLSKSNRNISINYKQSNFTKDFVELFKALPWVKGITLETIEDSIEFFKLDYESSDKTIKSFYVNVFSSDGEEFTLSRKIKSTYNNIPIASMIFWENIGYWTLNTNDIFKRKKLTLESAIKNDISNIIGDLTYILSDLQIKLTYNKQADSNAIIHPDYGTLIKVEIFQNGNYIESNFLELGIIDSMIDMQVDNVSRIGEQTVVIEKISYMHIFKLSTLIIRFLKKSGLSNTYNNTLTIRKSIIEFMKTISATISYAIPDNKSKQTDRLFKDAFGNTWVYERYKNRK